MNVAEHIRCAGAVESYLFPRSRLMKSEVKPFPAVKRKHAVKPWIEVRKNDDASHGHDQQIGFERLVVLHHTVVRSLRVESNRADRVQRNEPNHNTGTVAYVRTRVCLNQPDLRLDRLRHIAYGVVCLCRRRDEEDQKRRKDSKWTHLHSHLENEPHCQADLTGDRRSSRDLVSPQSPVLSRKDKVRAWPKDIIRKPHIVAVRQELEGRVEQSNLTCTTGAASAGASCQVKFVPEIQLDLHLRPPAKHPDSVKSRRGNRIITIEV